MSEAPRTIIVFAPNWLGDAILALPALAELRRHFPGARLAVAARAPLAPLFELVPGIDEIVRLEASGGPAVLMRAAADARAVSAARADVAVLLPHSFRVAWIAWRAGVPERWGYRGDVRRWLLTRAVGRPRERRHQSEYYAELLRRLGVPIGATAAPVVSVDDALRERARDVLDRHGWAPESPLVGLSPGAAYGGAKRWPPERVAELAVRLGRELGATCVLLGSAADRGTGREIGGRFLAAASGARDGAALRRPLDLIGETDLPLLAGVISWCRAVVSNDSGAMHLAAALDVPVAAIFGPTDERVTAPLASAAGRAAAIVTASVWCRPCLLRECPIDHRCMTGIPASQVFEAIRPAIESGGADRADRRVAG